MESIAARFEAALPAVGELLRTRGAMLGYVFGSVAEGRERADSDLDLAVLLRPEVPYEEYFDLVLELNTEIVGLTKTSEVDVVLLNTAPPLLAYEVISNGRLIYGPEEDRVEFEVEALKHFHDTAPLRRALREAFSGRLDALAAQLPEGHTPW